MITYLYGEDSYRRSQQLKELINAFYKEKSSGVDMAIFDFEDDPEAWEKAKTFINQPSMFVESKLVIIKEGGRVNSKEWIRILKKEADNPKVLILISDSKKTPEVINSLKRVPVNWQSFPELKGTLLFEFLKKEARKRNLFFSYDAWKYLSSYIASSKEKSWLVVNELEKLNLALLPQPISLVNLRHIIRFEKKEALFTTAINILKKRDFHNGLVLLEKMFLQKEAPAYIFNSLCFAAGGENALRLADYDVSVKSGGLEYEEALTDFVLQAS